MRGSHGENEGGEGHAHVSGDVQMPAMGGDDKSHDDRETCGQKRNNQAEMGRGIKKTQMRAEKCKHVHSVTFRGATARRQQVWLSDITCARKHLRAAVGRPPLVRYVLVIDEPPLNWNTEK